MRGWQRRRMVLIRGRESRGLEKRRDEKKNGNEDK